MLVKSKISPNKLIEGGAPIFIASKIKQNKDMWGKMLIKPFIMKILRVEVLSYSIFARQNIPEETKPWANIIKKLPAYPMD
jgi:hypothetical protein